jgi:hypothetical protein
MNTEFLRRFNLGGLFTFLFGMSAWIALSAFTFYLLTILFTPSQFCGYYIDHGSSYYEIKMRWKYGMDSTAYRTYDGKEAVEVLKRLNEQLTPLKIQEQRPKEP